MAIDERTFVVVGGGPAAAKATESLRDKARLADVSVPVSAL